LALFAGGDLTKDATDEGGSEMTDHIDAIELLLRDHRSIEGLVDQLDATDDPAEMRNLFLRIVEQLAAHEAAEHEVVFPAFRASLEGSGDATLDHRMGEHQELNELLAEMRSLAPDGFGFTKRESAFALEIKEHFRREEETVFARMRESLSADQLAELGDRALVVKQHSPAFPEEDPRIKTDR
jgi:hemerythrin superfamily protein